MASEHEIQTQLRKLTPGYCCTHCVFIGEAKTVEDHVLRMHHTGTAPFVCRKCDERFARKERARNHVRKNHPGTKANDAVRANEAQRLLERYARPATYEEERQVATARALKKRTITDPSSAEPQRKSSKSEDSPVLSVHAPREDPLLATPQSIPLTPLSPERSAASNDPVAPWTEVLTLHRQQLQQQQEQTALLSTLVDEQKSLRIKVDELTAKVEAQETRLINVAKALSCTQGEVHRHSNQLVTVEKNTTDSKKACDDLQKKLDSASSEIRAVSTQLTRMQSRETNATAELLHGHQRALEALEGRPSRTFSERRDDQRMDREEGARRQLDKHFKFWSFCESSELWY